MRSHLSTGVIYQLRKQFLVRLSDRKAPSRICLLSLCLMTSNQKIRGSDLIKYCLGFQEDIPMELCVHQSTCFPCLSWIPNNNNIQVIQVISNIKQAPSHYLTRSILPYLPFSGTMPAHGWITIYKKKRYLFFSAKQMHQYHMHHTVDGSNHEKIFIKRAGLVRILKTSAVVPQTARSQSLHHLNSRASKRQSIRRRCDFPVPALL